MTALVMRARALRIVCALAPVALAGGASVAGAQLFACSSFSEDGNARPDAASPADGGDAAIDAPPAIVDGGGAEAGRFCATPPALGLCADFDGLNEPVSFHFIEGIGSPELDTSLFLSPPASMKVRANGTPVYVRGQVSAPAFAERQRLSYETYQGAIDQDASLAEDAILSSITQGTVDACAFDVQTFGDKARFNLSIPDGDGGFTYQNFAMSAYPPPGRWSHVDVLLEKAAAEQAVTVTVRIDNVVALAPTVTQCHALSATPFVGVGFVGAGSGVPIFAEAHFDNVLFDSK